MTCFVHIYIRLQGLIGIQVGLTRQKTTTVGDTLRYLERFYYFGVRDQLNEFHLIILLPGAKQAF